MIAIDLNGTIKTFFKLPKVWNDANGTHLNITDGEAFGFYPVVTPDYDSRIEELSPIYFSNNTFTYDVIEVPIKETLAELKENAIKKLQSITNQKLLSTDWYVTRSFERNIAIPENIQNQRNSILESHNQQEIEINSLSKKTDIITYEFK